MLLFNRDIVIFHARNTSGYVPTCCKSWIDHWKINANIHENITCSISGCDKLAKVGSHISLIGVKGYYIVPCCYSCNNKGGRMMLKKRTMIISVKKKFCSSMNKKSGNKIFTQDVIIDSISNSFNETLKETDTFNHSHVRYYHTRTKASIQTRTYHQIEHITTTFTMFF
jgi:hypothetical protein